MHETLCEEAMKTLGALFGAITLLLTWANMDSSPPLDGVKADRIVVEKAKRKLTLYLQDKPLKEYRIALGRSPVGPKEREGDGRTPEGVYRIDSRNGASAYHLALHISYPDARDVESARNKGRNPGGAIMIHGMRKGLGWIGKLQRLVDWTAGCIAVTDEEVEEIWRVTPDGIPIEIRP